MLVFSHLECINFTPVMCSPYWVVLTGLQKHQEAFSKAVPLLCHDPTPESAVGRTEQGPPWLQSSLPSFLTCCPSVFLKIQTPHDKIICIYIFREVVYLSKYDCECLETIAKANSTILVQYCFILYFINILYHISKVLRSLTRFQIL